MMMQYGPDRRQRLMRFAECFDRGAYEEAEEWIRPLFDSAGADGEALFALAQVVFRQGRRDEAVALMERLLALDPVQAVYHNDYGVMLGTLERWPDAEAAHRVALVLDGANVDARFNLALALFRQQRDGEALTVLDELQRLAPSFAEQYVLRGELLQSKKQHADAVAAFSRAVELGLERADVLVNLGLALSDAGNKNEALALLVTVDGLAGDDATASFSLGNLLRDQGKLDEAIRCYRKAVALRPDFAEAHNNLGLVLQAQGDTVGAEVAFACALSAAPDMGAAHNNMGNARIKQGQMDLALACFRKAIELSPDSAEAWNNLGETYYCLLCLDEAEAAFLQALSIRSDCHEARLNLGILLLLKGDFERGWDYYETRWEMPRRRENRPRFVQPEWTGEPLDGKALLIYVEQGMGDNLQFVRFLPELRHLYPNARLYYWGLRPLMRLFDDLATRYGIELLPETVAGGVPPIDYHIALLSIPRCLGTTLETLPAAVPYLAPPNDLQAKWCDRMRALSGFRVGLVWAGGDVYQFDVFRTLSLCSLMPLFDIEGISWVSLQKGPAAGQIEVEGVKGRLADWMDEVDDFADTAAIVSQLDLVISVDTSVAHLAGAMGKPVWLLNRFNTDWRWMLDRADSPWYPTMRIFRQASFGDWGSVVASVVDALRQCCVAHRGNTTA
ncbi:tetratricopeptide repeat protein [Propionivibrio dicarboxylicus]|uniref:Tfp pilus assembly protein PilF n=1 Tax=Propionivibrio dicarboxylicus TaxID=83767 RepID=A0A1G8HBF8_9RHOO|nr:tetratricopeptide repeat protein [Propionivibrio dicarboxylicus]SDI03811.1 Tfp pilus assembly protein PilF [Propionivibrio dicarboxylicus]